MLTDFAGERSEDDLLVPPEDAFVFEEVTVAISRRLRKYIECLVDYDTFASGSEAVTAALLQMWDREREERRQRMEASYLAQYGPTPDVFPEVRREREGHRSDGP